MHEGWHGNEYLVLFEANEVAKASERYAVASWLPGYELLGLRGWDDLIVRGPTGGWFTVPTVPMLSSYLKPFAQPKEVSELGTDPRFTGRLKWYVMPIVFGGDPAAPENTLWIDHAEHAELVKWWNHKYRQIAGEQTD
jgi:hypothetical protein